MRSTFLSSQKSKGAHASDTLNGEYAEFLPLATHLRKALELSMLKVTGSIMEPDNYPMPAENTLEKLLHDRLVLLNERKRDYASYQFLAKRKHLEYQREHPKFVQKNWELLEQMNSPQSMFSIPGFKSELDVFNIQRPSLQFFDTHQGSADPAWFSGRPVYDQLALRIHRIVCLDETNIESNSDTIALSALIAESEIVRHRLPDGSINPIAYNNTFRKNITLIGKNIGDGWEMRPNPYPWNYHIFNIWNPSGADGLPKYRCCTFLLSELDNGGFDEFVEKALKKITQIVVDAVAAYIGKKIGEQAGKGFAASAFGSFVGGAIGAISVYLLFEFIELMIDWWKDDVFPPQIADISVPSFQPFLAINGLESELKYCNFHGHGGHYRLEYYWQLLSSTNRGPSLSEGYVPPPPTVRGATIFSNVMYEGRSRFMVPGHYSLAPSNPWVLHLNSFDKQVDSVKIDPGFLVFAYKTPDFKGEYLLLEDDTPWLDDQWRDAISSVVVIDMTIPR